MQKAVDGGSAEGLALLEQLIRQCVAGWDADAVVRSSVRPDGKCDMTVISKHFEERDDRDREAEFWPVLEPVPKSEMVYLTYFLLLTPEEDAQSFGDAPQVSGTPAENWDE